MHSSKWPQIDKIVGELGKHGLGRPVRLSVVLTFGRCAAYAADQDAASTAVGWAESFDSAAGARQAALSECGS